MLSKWYTATANEIQAEAVRRKRIPDAEFKIVLDWATIPTADFILMRIGQDGRSEFMLAKRNEEPWKGQFLVPGGRILPGMTPKEAVKANCLRELGFTPEMIEFRGHLPVFNPARSDGSPEPWYSLWNLHLIQVSLRQEIRPNKENGELRWFKEVDRDLPEPAQQALRMVGCPDREGY
jgi:ADP-ribose pyrophosphatase YjhB (NUDIX family)